MIRQIINIYFDLVNGFEERSLFNSICIKLFQYLLMFCIAATFMIRKAGAQILNPADFKHYVNSFNQTDSLFRIDYPGINYIISDDSCWSWMKDNIPFFDCPDKKLEKTYYFRWYSYSKHIERTPEGYVITEFLPGMSNAGKYNTISCAAGHHYYEGRWLHNQQYLNDYTLFWLKKGKISGYSYSNWMVDAIYHYYLVTGNRKFITDLLPELINNYQEWQKRNQDSTGLFWQLDVRDGMEESISGNGYRPTINSYLFADALAISKIARLVHRDSLAKEYEKKALRQKKLVQQRLWNKKDHFFEVLHRGENTSLAGVREELGYIPWYFNLPDVQYSIAWKFLMDTSYFRAPYGPTTAERNNPLFMYKPDNNRICLWNGYSWPYATSQTLTAMINLLNNYKQQFITKEDFFNLLQTYSRSQRIKLQDGKVVPWIGESLNPFTGEWYTRNKLVERGATDINRGIYYNHSSFNDIIITGIVGIRPSEGNELMIHPLLPENQWDYFCLDRLLYHGKRLTVLYDKDGMHYHRGKGLIVFENEKKIASSATLRQLMVKL